MEAVARKKAAACSRQHHDVVRESPGLHLRHRRLARRGYASVSLALLAIGSGSAGADTETAAASRESLEDAWWTGPLLASNARVSRPGHGVIEPYFSDLIADGRYDAAGNRRAAARSHSVESQIYLGYGLCDGAAVGLLTRFAYVEPAGAPNSSSPGLGDLDLRLQVALTTFHEGRWVPDTAILLIETLPTGRYDRLERASDGLGSGVVTTALSWLSQDYLWLQNGRIIRIRLAVSYSLSGSATLNDASVYGTTLGFRGHVNPGGSVTADSAAEYSLTRQWVIATDLVYQHTDSTHVTGMYETVRASFGSVDLQSGARERVTIAPALEFNWSQAAGVIIGAQVSLAGRNTPASVTPMVALNLHY